jgi:hypothetical protein
VIVKKYCNLATPQEERNLLVRDQTFYLSSDKKNLNLSKSSFIPDAGWHFSYLGGAEKIIEKIHSFSHVEFNNVRYTNKRKS